MMPTFCVLPCPSCNGGVVSGLCRSCGKEFLLVDGVLRDKKSALELQMQTGRYTSSAQVQNLGSLLYEDPDKGAILLREISAIRTEIQDLRADIQALPERIVSAASTQINRTAKRIGWVLVAILAIGWLLNFLWK
jgi:hypothetical protein